MENEKSVLRWGGLAGIMAFIVWIVGLPLFGFVDPFTPEGLMRFTDVRAALGMSTILMMTIAILSIALVLALYRALRGTNLAFALFGSVLGVTGYIVTALGDASTFFAFTLHIHRASAAIRRSVDAWYPLRAGMGFLQKSLPSANA